MLLLPPVRGVPPALPCGGGRRPEMGAGCFAGDECDWGGGEGRPVAETSEPLATLPAYRGESGELESGPSSRSAVFSPEPQAAETGCEYGSAIPDSSDAPPSSRWCSG